jgi:hypothetical protein
MATDLELLYASDAAYDAANQRAFAEGYPVGPGEVCVYDVDVAAAHAAYPGPAQTVHLVTEATRTFASVNTRIRSPLEESISQCFLLREIIGDPFRAAAQVDRDRLRWNTGHVSELAKGAYDTRSLPDGTLNPGRLALLADSLEDAGCTDGELLGHLRSPGPHLRGCWAVDLVLGKS